MRERIILSEVSKRELLSLLPNEVTLEKIKNLFAVVEGQNNPKISWEAEFILDLDRLGIPNKNQDEFGWGLHFCKRTDETSKPFKTTAGRYVVNLFLFGGAKSIRENSPYYNSPFNKRLIGTVGKSLSVLLLEGKITSDEYIDYIDREQWLSFAPTSFVSPSFDNLSNKPIKEVITARDKMYEDNKEALDNYSLNSMILYQGEEKKLLKMAEDILDEKNSPGLDIYRSGASGSFGNNYRNVALMRGYMPKSDDPSQFSFSTSNLMDGIKPDETAPFADLAILASFSRAVGTQDGGYLTKKVNASFQHVGITPDSESDCGTKRFLSVKLDKDNRRGLHLQYYKNDEGKLELLTMEKLESFPENTVIEVRSTLFCLDKKYCSRCMGQLYYSIGIEKVGLLLNRITSNVLNKSLKKFHDLTVKISDLDYLEKIESLD